MVLMRMLPSRSFPNSFRKIFDGFSIRNAIRFEAALIRSVCPGIFNSGIKDFLNYREILDFFKNDVKLIKKSADIDNEVHEKPFAKKQFGIYVERLSGHFL